MGFDTVYPSRLVLIVNPADRGITFRAEFSLNAQKITRERHHSELDILNSSVAALRRAFARDLVEEFLYGPQRDWESIGDLTP